MDTQTTPSTTVVPVFVTVSPNNTLPVIEELAAIVDGLERAPGYIDSHFLVTNSHEWADALEAFARDCPANADLAWKTIFRLFDLDALRAIAPDLRLKVIDVKRQAVEVTGKLNRFYFDNPEHRLADEAFSMLNVISAYVGYLNRVQETRLSDCTVIECLQGAIVDALELLEAA